jgi:hypothetical protein
VDILENQPITNNCCEGFNHGWTTTMNKRPSLFLVLEGFLNKESWSQQILREDSLAVGGNNIDANKSRKLAAVNRRQDLQALVRDYHKMMPHIFLDSIVKFFSND